MGRECCDCKENDRSYSFNLYYKCQNDWCDNYIDLGVSIKKMLCEPSCNKEQILDKPLQLKRYKIDEFFTVDYIIKKRTIQQL